MTRAAPRATAPPSTTRPADEAAQRVRDLVEYQVLANARPATRDTIGRDLTTPDVLLLERDGEPLEVALADALTALVHGGQVVEVPGGYAPRACSPDVSRRARVWSLCGRAALVHGRAVRAGEVWNYATAYAPGDVEASALSKTHVINDLLSLTVSKLVVVIGTVRGGHQGLNLVVPARFVSDDTSWLPTEPLTWLDYVADAMGRMLAQDARDTFAAKELRVFLAQDIRTRAADNRPTPVGDLRPSPMLAALIALASPNDPVVRRVPGCRAVWKLAVQAATADTTTPAPPRFAADADRIVEAARRVTVTTGRPVVTVHDIRAALAADPHLALANEKGLAVALTDLAKEHVYVGGGRTAARRVRRVRRVGLLDGNAAYWVATGTDDDARWEAAQRVVASRGVFDAMTRGAFLERIAQLKNVVSPVIATGRARQMLHELAPLRLRVQALPSTTEGLADQVATLEEYTTALRGWLQFRTAHAPGMPSDIQPCARGLTALAVRDLFAPINPTAARLTGTANIVRQYWSEVRRFPNPQFKGVRSGDPTTAARFLFDQVDAISYAARQWGGPRCRLHALWAFEELGELRDARYVLVALASESAAVRQRVIGTLALLQPPEVIGTLLNHARNDVDAGVRECALWALGLVMRDAATAVLTEVVTRDPDANVRRTARAYLTLGDLWWWRV